ncbi:MFS transporter, partial [Ensifer sp. NM-2]|uniref:MFS transporter n=1 Tax=Ensifer sp. NM-2 TaxID=2109730 RepID=UPI001FDECDB3
MLIVARAVQGIGGGVLPLTFGIIRDEFPSQKVAPSIATASSLLGASTAIGLVVAGPIVALLGHRWLFWIPMLCAVLVLILAALIIPRTNRDQTKRINWIAGIVLSVWTVILL